MKLLFLIAIPLYAQSTFFVSSYLNGDDWLPTKDDSLVAWRQFPTATDYWTDLSGNSIDDTLNNSPTLNTANLNGHNTITLNGTDESGRARFTLNAPFTVIILFRSISWTSNDYIFDGGGVNKTYFRQNQSVGATMYYQMVWGSGSALSQNLGTNVGSTYLNWWIATAVYDTTTGYIRLNEGSKSSLSGTVGTGSALGFTIGARGDLNASWSNIEVAAIIITHAISDLTLLRHRRYLNKIFQVY